MSSAAKSLDVLGIKGLSDSVRIVTQGMIDGAAALLGRICLPAAEEFGELLRDGVKKWRTRNTVLMLDRAEPLIKQRELSEGRLEAPPQIVYRAIEFSSWSDDESLQSMWAGLLASACSPDGKDESNLVYAEVVSHFSPAQARLFEWIADNCPKVHDTAGTAAGDHFQPPIEALLEIGRAADCTQLESELGRLHSAGLFHKTVFDGTVLEQCKGLSPFGLNLYLRVKGLRGDPKMLFQTVFSNEEVGKAH